VAVAVPVRVSTSANAVPVVGVADCRNEVEPPDVLPVLPVVVVLPPEPPPHAVNATASKQAERAARCMRLNRLEGQEGMVSMASACGESNKGKQCGRPMCGGRDKPLNRTRPDTGNVRV